MRARVPVNPIAGQPAISSRTQGSEPRARSPRSGSVVVVLRPGRNGSTEPSLRSVVLTHRWPAFGQSEVVVLAFPDFATAESDSAVGARLVFAWVTDALGRSE